jgi:hypothetical protein
MYFLLKKTANAWKDTDFRIQHVHTCIDYLKILTNETFMHTRIKRTTTRT